MHAVWFNVSIGVCLALLVFGGPIAIGAIFSIGGVAAYVAFAIPLFIRTFFVGNRFRRGPWHLGRWYLPIDTAAVAFVALMVPVLCLPAYRGDDLTAETMNWTCLVYGGPMLGALVWYAVDARKWFKGPKVNVEHQMLGRGGRGGDAGEAEGKMGSQSRESGSEEGTGSDGKAADIA